MNIKDAYWRYYQPANPIARFGMMLLALGVLALTFVLGLVVLVIAAGAALVGSVILSLRAGPRNVMGGEKKKPPTEPGIIEGEFRVISDKSDKN